MGNYVACKKYTKKVPKGFNIFTSTHLELTAKTYVTIGTGTLSKFSCVFVAFACGKLQMDDVLFHDLDWDPDYLAGIFDTSFDNIVEIGDMWCQNELVSDHELINSVENVGREVYKPIVEDISMDDDTLCHAVEQIESE